MGERAAPLLLIGAVLVAFAFAPSAAFQFDDFHLVVRNPDVHSWSAWAASMPGIRPLTKASLTFCWLLSPAPAAFVAASLLCHVLAALLVLALARRWVPALASGCRRPAFAALATALVFALHPAQTEAVTYVSGRAVVLSGVFYLLSLLAFERAQRGISVMAFALALLSRETSWTLPFALVLLAYARGATLRDSLRRSVPHFALLAVAAVAIAALPSYRDLLDASLAHRSPGASLYAQAEGISYLVTHPLATLRVNLDPDIAVPASPGVRWWLSALAILGVIAAGFALLRRVPWVGFGILWFFLQIAPTNSVVARYDLASDRALYLALIGPALIAGVTLARWRHAPMAAIAATALAATLGIATLVRNFDYASEIALWEATVASSPAKPRPWNNLGYARQMAGDTAGARAAYERALALDPDYARARINLDLLPAR